MITMLQLMQEVRYCSEDGDHRAQIARVVSDTVVDLNVYDAFGGLSFGVTEAIKAETPSDRIVPGHWWIASS